LVDEEELAVFLTGASVWEKTWTRAESPLLQSIIKFEVGMETMKKEHQLQSGQKNEQQQKHDEEMAGESSSQAGPELTFKTHVSVKWNFRYNYFLQPHTLCVVPSTTTHNKTI
jgi:hypothetical protein